MSTQSQPQVNGRSYLGQAFIEPFRVFYQHRRLIWEITRRDVVNPFAGQILGGLWAFIHPLFLMLLYAVVFGFLVGARFGGTVELPLDYTVFLLSGLVPWLTVAEVLGRASGEIVANRSLVKQVVFPIEVLPYRVVMASLFRLAIGLLFLLGYLLLSGSAMTPLLLLLPLVILLQVVFMSGVAFLLAAVGVFVRDIKDIVQLFVLAGIYILPIIYIPTSIPPILKPIIYLNPFSYMIYCYRDAVYFGRFETPAAWILYPLLSFLTLVVGYSIFKRLQVFFSNVL